MPTARGFHAAAALDGRIYVVGGYDGQRELAVHEVFIPDEGGPGRWERGMPLTVPRGGLGLAATDKTLVAIGGGWTQPLTTQERYDVRQGEWKPFESPFLGQWRHLGVVALEHQVLALGGFSGAPLSTVQIYQTTFRGFLPIGG